MNTGQFHTITTMLLVHQFLREISANWLGENFASTMETVDRGSETGLKQWTFELQN